MCVFLCLPIARLSSFCTLELTPTILYKPCSLIPGGEGRGEVNSCSCFMEILNQPKHNIYLCTSSFEYCTLAAFDTSEHKGNVHQQENSKRSQIHALTNNPKLNSAGGGKQTASWFNIRNCNRFLNLAPLNEDYITQHAFHHQEQVSQPGLL